ncbi:MAG: alpha/beta hydrolase fold domain-containing protein, partial [Candidatus Microthrix subdominans]
MTATPRLHPVGRAARVLIGLLARRGDEIVRDGRRLAPEMRAVLAVAKRVAPTNDRDIARARIDIRRSVMVGPPVPPGVHTWERDIPGPAGDVRVRFYRDADTEPGAPAICFFHGGGWVVGDLDSHDPPCRVLAQRTGAVVMAVDYRLAPEAPYPAAVEDCVAA